MDPDRQPGIRFESVYLREARYQELPEGEIQETRPEKLNLSIGVRTRLQSKQKGSAGPDQGEIRLKATVEPNLSPPPYFVEVVVGGTFNYLGEDRSNLDLEEFFSEQAPALLFPFAREAITNLTARTRFGAVLIPPVNVRALLKAEENSIALRAEREGQE